MCIKLKKSQKFFIDAADIHAKEDLVRENLVLVLEEDYIDLEESAIDNILLTIPMQVLSEEEQNSDTMPSGNSWSVLTEEQYNALQNKKKKENSPRYKACRQRHEIVPNTILMPQIIGNFRSV